MFGYSERSRRAEKDVEDRIKNIIPSSSYDFLNRDSHVITLRAEA